MSTVAEAAEIRSSIPKPENLFFVNQRQWELVWAAHQGQKVRGKKVLDVTQGICEILKGDFGVESQEGDEALLRAGLLRYVVEESCLSMGQVRAAFGEEVGNILNPLRPSPNESFSDRVERFSTLSSQTLMLEAATCLFWMNARHPDSRADSNVVWCAIERKIEKEGSFDLRMMIASRILKNFYQD